MESALQPSSETQAGTRLPVPSLAPSANPGLALEAGAMLTLTTDELSPAMGTTANQSLKDLAQALGLVWIEPQVLLQHVQLAPESLPWHLTKRWQTVAVRAIRSAVTMKADAEVLVGADQSKKQGDASSAASLINSTREDELLYFVCADPASADLREAIEARVATEFVWACSTTDAIAALIATQEAEASALSALSDEAADQHAPAAAEEAVVRLLTLENVEREPNPVVRLVDSTLLDAVTFGASDIHLERGRQGLRIRYRVDGVLEDTDAPPVGLQMAEQLISRIKVLADLDVTERRVPQDGRLRFRVTDRAIDVRVSILPGSFGEEAVLRMLDKKSLVQGQAALTLASLGLDAPSAQQIRRLAARPYGMLLITGPTGSGKSTTLYAAVSEINNGRDKIITIEDPVEYELPGVLQIPVDEKKGLTFARGLRSILRHDPDRILVGEIRDRETAEIAVQAALTGHLVFSTVHANDAFDVVGRLIHMGVEPYAFMTAINGVVAQRLVRRRCSVCRGQNTPSAALRCLHCRGSGYRGRLAVAEVLEFDDRLRAMVVERQPLAQVKDYARGKGLVGLRAKALDLVAQEATSQEEIDRVTVAET